jgi:hypothetical protein
MSNFTVDVYQNEYLPLGGSEVNAIVTVSSDGAVGQAGRALTHRQVPVNWECFGLSVALSASVSW